MAMEQNSSALSDVILNVQETIGITDRIYDRGGAEESTESLQLQSIALNAECERQVIVESGPSARYYFQCNLKLIKKC